MIKSISRIGLAGIAASALVLSGCATVESVEKAQATADQAMSQAQGAQSTAQAAGAAAQRAQGTADSAGAAAQRAQSSADAAAATAQTAAADAHQANDRLDHMTPVVGHLEHHHGHQTWHNVKKHPRHHQKHTAKMVQH